MSKCPKCGFDPAPDKRAGKWRCRFRLYREGQPDPYADSDDGLPPDQPGLEIYEGLPEVAETLRKMALQIHCSRQGAGVGGLELETLLHKLKALRPTISRRGGNAVWRVPYIVQYGDQTDAWLARVDVVRVS
jgi:hypothetical protein